MTEQRQEQIAQQQERLAAHRRTLAHYLQRQAILGAAHLPPEVTHGIVDARDEIRRIKHILRRWGLEAEDHPDDEGGQEAQPSAPARTAPDSAEMPRAKPPASVSLSSASEDGIPAHGASGRQIKKEAREQYLADLLEEYAAAHRQLGFALDEVDRLRIQRKIVTLEKEIARVERELGSF
jgi:hypothetical protein